MTKTKLQDHDPMPLGKHAGTMMRDVPPSYLLWCADQPFKDETRWRDVVDYVEANRKVLELEANEGDENDEHDGD